MIELSSSIVAFVAPAVEATKPYPPRDRSLPSSLPGYERRDRETERERMTKLDIIRVDIFGLFINVYRRYIINVE